MSEPKPFASLGPSLLARKGGARPAMRPQLAALQPAQLIADHDDLGWNDMGHDHASVAPVVAPVVVPVVAPAVVPVAQSAPASLPQLEIVPEVVRQQQEVVRRLNAPRRSALADGRRAAFTLRVDAERHLKLRLACTLKNRSAQQLITDALDRLLDELPDVADLAAQVARRRKN